MISAALSVLCAILSAFGAPIGLPVIGLALGANAALKETRLPARLPRQRYLAWAGIALNGIVVAMILLSQRAPAR